MNTHKDQSQPLHIHIQGRVDAPQVFQMTRERWKCALAHHPDLANRIRCTFAYSATSNVSKWTPQDLSNFARAMATANVLVSYWFPTADLAKVAPHLFWIHIIGAGVEYLFPLDWLPKGVKLVNNKGVHAPKTVEYSMLAILMIGNAIPRLCTAQRQNRWEQYFTTVIEGKILVIVGLGEQGIAVARAAKKLGLRIIGIDISVRSCEYCDEIVTPEGMLRALADADFVGVTVPLTAKTRNLIGRRELDAMKKSAGLFNIARGPVVDYAALAEKLSRGELGGAVLDVFDPEPLPSDSPLWSTPNLMITPHVGCDDADNYIIRTFELVLENVRRHFTGEQLMNLVHANRGF